MTVKPVDVGNWDINTVAHTDVASIVSSVQILPLRPRPASVYEIHSIRATMSEDGTGDLASMGIADAEVAEGAGVANTDNALMELRQEFIVNTFSVGNVHWHWGRSNQIALQEPTIYMPPGLLWDGEMWGVFQNGAGASIVFLFTVIYRIVRFAERDFPTVIAHILPRTATKHLTTTS